MPNDLLDAVIEQLRDTSSVTTAFGDTWDPSTSVGTIKFFADYASDFALPYLVLYEGGETYEYMTRTTTTLPLDTVNFTCSGQFQCSIFSPNSRYVARQLGQKVSLALNDVALNWTGQTLMLLRNSAAFFRPITDVGPAAPSVFNRVLTFDYMYEGQIA